MVTQGEFATNDKPVKCMMCNGLIRKEAGIGMYRTRVGSTEIQSLGYVHRFNATCRLKARNEKWLVFPHGETFGEKKKADPTLHKRRDDSEW